MCEVREVESTSGGGSRRNDVVGSSGADFATSVCSYPKVAISKHFTVNQAETLIEAQRLI